MTDYPLTWLAEVLRAGGCRVVEESGWKTRGRPSSSGSFHPKALLRHWDASAPGSHGALSTVLEGSEETPGPLCSIFTCRGNDEHAPSVHTISAGRANHGGSGSGWGVIPPDGANTYAVGHEIAQTVDEPWPADQLDQVRMAEAAILKRLGARASNALCAHSEYAPDRKIDTTGGSHGQNMNHERSTIQGIIDGGGGGDDLKHHYVRVLSKVAWDLSRDGTTISFEKEESDTGETHAAGKAAIVAPFNCVMSGVVQVHGAGRRAISVRRYATDGEVIQSESYDESSGGWSNSPFSSVWTKGQALRVVLTDLDGDSTATSVRLYCDIVER